MSDQRPRGGEMGGLDAPSPLHPPHEVLPHRAPFLFLDRVSECGELRVVGWRRFTPSEPFFEGHFPERPVVPGVILIEALAQTLGYWALRARPNHWVLLTGVESAKFSQLVEPNDELCFEVSVLKARHGVVIAEGLCSRAGEVVAQAKLKGFLQPR